MVRYRYKGQFVSAAKAAKLGHLPSTKSRVSSEIASPKDRKTISYTKEYIPPKQIVERLSRPGRPAPAPARPGRARPAPAEPGPREFETAVKDFLDIVEDVKAEPDAESIEEARSRFDAASDIFGSFDEPDEETITLMDQAREEWEEIETLAEADEELFGYDPLEGEDGLLDLIDVLDVDEEKYETAS